MFKYYSFKEIPYKSGNILIRSGLSYPLKRKVPTIIYVNKHPVTISLSSSEETKMIRAKQYFLLPPGITCHIKAEKTSELFTLQIPNIVYLYTQYINSQIKKTPYDAKNLFYPLDTVSLIDLMVENIKSYRKEDRNSPVLIGIKCHELFYLLKHCYTEDNLQLFFSPIFQR